MLHFSFWLQCLQFTYIIFRLANTSRLSKSNNNATFNIEIAYHVDEEIARI